MGTELTLPRPLPAVVSNYGPAAATAWRDFFEGKLANDHTRAAYNRAVRGFMKWLEDRGQELQQATAGDVGEYFRQLELAVPTKKLHLSAIRRFFNLLVERHICLINPAAVAEVERYQAVEGKTPEITPKQVQQLIKSTPTDGLVGLRDRAIIAVLASTAARAGAVARLRRQDFHYAGNQWLLHFDEKGGKSRQIPVRHDLKVVLHEYLDAAGLRRAPKKSPLFRSWSWKFKRLTKNPMTSVDICRLVKRRIKQADLPNNLSPHSFRVMVITDLLDQGEDITDVARLAGHADTRTTALYDRSDKRVRRNLVERIRISLPGG